MIMTNRVGDFSHQTRLNDLMSVTRGRVRSLETQVASGKSAQHYSDIPKDTGLLLRTREQLATGNNFIQQNQRLTDQLQATDGALGDIVSVAERLRMLLVQRLNDPTGSDVPLDTEAKAMTEEVVSRLNFSVDGRYLFAGTKTDQRPVSLPTANITASDPSLYYRGDDIDRTARVDEQIQLGVGVRADHPAFADLLNALGTAWVGHSTSDRSKLQTSLNLAEQALSGVVELRSKLGATAARVADVTESQRSSALYLDESRGRIEDTDIAATMTRMAQDKVAIEASYLIVSQISKLSLADYLR